MVDPKRVEFAPYDGIPHLYVPVVTERREAASALSWAVAEMERRLKVFSQGAACATSSTFNEKVRAEPRPPTRPREKSGGGAAGEPRAASRFPTSSSSSTSWPTS